MAPLTSLSLRPERTIAFASSGGSASTTLTLVNQEGHAMAYKIKTTAPKSYLVRPSTGVLAAREVRPITILLQAGVRVENDRFLVQAAPLDPATQASLEAAGPAAAGPGATVQLPSREFWTELPKERIQEQRLSVAFDDEGEGEAAGGGAAGGGPLVAPDAGAANSRSVEEYMRKYNEVLQYSLAVEREKSKLEEELRSVRAQLAARGGGAAGAAGKPPAAAAAAAGGAGWETWHVIVLLAVFAAVMKLFSIL